ASNRLFQPPERTVLLIPFLIPILGTVAARRPGVMLSARFLPAPRAERPP
ncbi:MAG: hypothetical protein K0S56_3828, partial [Microvirga sp.]|nr:hypothetical protein [Microvirga sp.]